MAFRYRPYRYEDMEAVRRFISQAYTRTGRPNAWLTARWDFEIFFMRSREGTLAEWGRQIGLWENESGELVGIALRDGDYYMQFDSLSPPDVLIEDLFDFMERQSSEEHAQSCKLAIPSFMTRAEEIAADRGYERLPSESDSAISIALDREYDAALPGGFRLLEGQDVPDAAKALAHTRAFHYEGTDAAAQVLRLYGGLREAPGYRSDLDLAIVTERGEVAAFCNLFTDADNRIGMLEPVGTVPDYRKLGLGRAVIYEGLNRLRALGMIKAYTGPYQPFYEAIGFRREVEYGVWAGRIKVTSSAPAD